jgi:DNA-directed RNA polymerase specialized sigma24 family protein
MGEQLDDVAEPRSAAIAFELKARPIVEKAVQRELALFAAFPDVDRDNLTSEGMAAVRVAQLRNPFDPKRAAFSTWVYRSASFRLIDLWRHRSRQLRNETCVARRKVEYHEYDDGGVTEEDILDWCKRIYRDCRICFGSATRRIHPVRNHVLPPHFTLEQ